MRRFEPINRGSEKKMLDQCSGGPSVQQRGVHASREVLNEVLELRVGDGEEREVLLLRAQVQLGQPALYLLHLVLHLQEPPQRFPELLSPRLFALHIHTHKYYKYVCICTVYSVLTTCPPRHCE